jgi:hypothetical protein
VESTKLPSPNKKKKKAHGREGRVVNTCLASVMPWVGYQFWGQGWGEGKGTQAPRLLINILSTAGHWWLTTVILTTQEAEIRRIMVRKPCPISTNTQSKKG